MENFIHDKDECVKWLKDRGMSAAGNLNELQMRIRKTLLYPSLSEKLKRRAEKNIIFDTSLNLSDIPPITAAWSSKDELLPSMSSTNFKEYASKKREGSIGQQQKAYCMLTSRKIRCIKSFIEENGDTFVKALIKKSYGSESRPAIILFHQSVPFKAYCECPVGRSGLCCHVLAVLLFLKHFTDTKEKILELTCTQQLQTWHRRSTKGSIPTMVPLRQIKLKSAKAKKSLVHDLKITPADPKQSTFKRDVLQMKQVMQEKLICKLVLLYMMIRASFSD